MSQFVKTAFGTPYQERKVFIFYYWLAVSLYFSGLLVVTYKMVTNYSATSLVVHLFNGLFIPFALRFIYCVTIKIHKIQKEKC